VRHTEQIRQIRKIRQIRDPRFALGRSAEINKTKPGNGFRGPCGLRGSLRGRGGLHAPSHCRPLLHPRVSSNAIRRASYPGLLCWMPRRSRAAKAPWVRRASIPSVAKQP